MNKKIEFLAGYYEWCLYIDDIFVYSNGDDFIERFNNDEDKIKAREDFYEYCMNYGELIKYCIEDLIHDIKKDECENITPESKEILLSITNDDLAKISDVICNAYYNYYVDII